MVTIYSSEDEGWVSRGKRHPNFSKLVGTVQRFKKKVNNFSQGAQKKFIGTLSYTD